MRSFLSVPRERGGNPDAAPAITPRLTPEPRCRAVQACSGTAARRGGNPTGLSEGASGIRRSAEARLQAASRLPPACIQPDAGLRWARSFRRRAGSGMRTDQIVATFSIVAFDPETDSLGVAVQSKFLAVGSVVPWARAGAGAVATQAMANYNYGPRGLELMARGKTADETVGGLISTDEDREHRQGGAVDARGRAATFTGSECFEWAGGATGEHYAAQGNILVGRETVEAMARTYRETQGDLATRLLSSLDAGQAAGGDSRGKQSAALLVVREGGGCGGDNDTVVDLRVDDHPDPIGELVRIRDLHTLYFGETRPQDVVGIDGDVRREVADVLRRRGYIQKQDIENDDLFDALSAYIRTENFEEREQRRGYLDRAVLEYMKGQS